MLISKALISGRVVLALPHPCWTTVWFESRMSLNDCVLRDWSPAGSDTGRWLDLVDTKFTDGKIHWWIQSWMDYLRWVLVGGSRSAGIPLKDISTLVALSLLLHPEAGSLCYRQAANLWNLWDYDKSSFPPLSCFPQVSCQWREANTSTRVLMSPKPEQPLVSVTNSWDSSGGSQGHLDVCVGHREHH